MCSKGHNALNARLVTFSYHMEFNSFNLFFSQRKDIYPHYVPSCTERPVASYELWIPQVQILLVNSHVVDAAVEIPIHDISLQEIFTDISVYSQFHNHAQWLQVTNPGGPLDNHRLGIQLQASSRNKSFQTFWFSYSHNCTLANGADFHSVCQV